MENAPFLSVVIPAYNEANRIGRTLMNVREYLSRAPYRSEVIVVDDGSKDPTAEVVRSYADPFAAADIGLRVLGGGTNRGKGHAVKEGMLSAAGRYRLFMDADGSVSISELDRFMPLAKNGADVVIGSIELPDAKVTEHNGWHRRFLGSLSKLLIRKLVVPGIYDTQRGFKLFSERAAKEVFPRQRIERFGFDIEILAIAQEHGFRIRELPVEFDNPAGSTVKGSDYLRTMREMIEILSNKLANAYA